MKQQTKTMNINKPLFEETDNLLSFKNFDKPTSSEMVKYDINNLDKFMQSKHLQFITNKGAILANIDVEIDNPISLNYHYKKSSDFESFIKSVNEFLKFSELELTDSDISTLNGVYQNHIRKIVKEPTLANQVIQALI